MSDQARPRPNIEPDPMTGTLKPTDIEALARYSAERLRGIVHTPEWVARMARLQQAFNERERRRMEAAGAIPLEGGGWLVPERGGSWWQWWRRVGG